MAWDQAPCTTQGDKLTWNIHKKHRGTIWEWVPLNYQAGPCNSLFYLRFLAKNLVWLSSILFVSLLNPGSHWEIRWIKARQTNSEPHLHAGSKFTHNTLQMWYMGVSNLGHIQGIQRWKNIFFLSSKECISKHHPLGSALSGKQKQLLQCKEQKMKQITSIFLAGNVIPGSSSHTPPLLLRQYLSTAYKEELASQKPCMANTWKCLHISKYTSKYLSSWVIFLSGGECKFQTSQAEEGVEPRSALCFHARQASSSSTEAGWDHHFPRFLFAFKDFIWKVEVKQKNKGKKKKSGLIKCCIFLHSFSLAAKFGLGEEVTQPEAQYVQSAVASSGSAPLGLPDGAAHPPLKPLSHMPGLTRGCARLRFCF